MILIERLLFFFFILLNGCFPFPGAYNAVKMAPKPIELNVTLSKQVRRFDISISVEHKERKKDINERNDLVKFKEFNKK